MTYPRDRDRSNELYSSSNTLDRVIVVDEKAWLFEQARTDVQTDCQSAAWTVPPSNHSRTNAMSRSAALSVWVRRMIIAFIFLLIVLMITWNRYISPQWADDHEYRQGFLSEASDGHSNTKAARFNGVKIQDLPLSLLPGGPDDSKGLRRLIFVGDIHGCADEFKHLLEKVRFNESMDHLIAVGDVISKGPDSVGVMNNLININASSVRGNHEDRILAIAPSVLDSTTSPQPNPEEPTSNTFTKDSALLRQLSPYHLRYLQDMPLMLRIPPLPLAGTSSHQKGSPLTEELIVVHAGLVPAVALEKQDPYFVMNMRAIQTKTHAPMVEAESKQDKSKPWHDIWCWYNERLSKHKSIKDFAIYQDLPDEDDGSPEELSGDGWFEWLKPVSKKKYPQPQVVVYGHRSKEGLKIKRWTKGLDSGCVKGGELTALVLKASGEQDIVQVGCEDHRT